MEIICCIVTLLVCGICVCVCECVCACVCVCVCVCVFMCLCLHAHVCVCVSVLVIRVLVALWLYHALMGVRPHVEQEKAGGSDVRAGEPVANSASYRPRQAAREVSGDR